MLRLLHTADWHLGKRLGRFERLDEQQRALETLLHHADQERVDIVLIAGDIFDSPNPSAEAQALFYDALHELARGGERPVIAIAGNHDSPERLEASARWGYPLGILLVGFPHSPLPPAGTRLGQATIGFSSTGILLLEHPRWRTPLCLLPLPYVSPYRLQQELTSPLSEWLRTHWNQALQTRPDHTLPTVALAHLFCSQSGTTPPAEDEEEKPLTLGNAELVPTDIFPQQLHYVALGHIHRRLQLDSNGPTIAYSGSLLPYSFSDPEPEKYAALVEISPAGVQQLRWLPLSGGYPLRRLTCQSVEEALQELERHRHAYVELLLHCDQALAAEDYHRLLAAHPRLVALIPVPRQAQAAPAYTPETLASMDELELFVAFFRSRKGIDPDPALQELFASLLRSHRSLPET